MSLRHSLTAHCACSLLAAGGHGLWALTTTSDLRRLRIPGHSWPPASSRRRSHCCLRTPRGSFGRVGEKIVPIPYGPTRESNPDADRMPARHQQGIERSPLCFVDSIHVGSISLKWARPMSPPHILHCQVEVRPWSPGPRQTSSTQRMLIPCHGTRLTCRDPSHGSDSRTVSTHLSDPMVIHRARTRPHARPIGPAHRQPRVGGGGLPILPIPHTE